MSSPFSAEAPATWSLRWARLAARCGIAEGEPLLLALSGGADSVFLLHLLARARPRPPLSVVHVDHGLRGEESGEDARFCSDLAARLELPFSAVSIGLDPAAGDLERRAREARYAALAEEARRHGIRTIVTGHHSDDALETLMIRWLRGADLAALAGLPRRTTLGVALGARPGEPPIEIVRPLLDLRRAEIRRLLTLAGLSWREDSSNGALAPTRNRIRHVWLPQIASLCGEEALENLRTFHDTVRSFEDRLARHTAHLAWRPPLLAAAQRSRREAHLGGCLERAPLAALPGPLRRRALWRLVGEGCGHPPGRALLDAIDRDLARGGCTRHTLGAGWTLQLRSQWLHLSPPVSSPNPRVIEGELALPVPGSVDLGDGCGISARIERGEGERPIPRSEVEVELSLPAAPLELTVRFPRPGDRFHGLGAPGSRPLGRFLADAGIPREERARVPVVLSAGEIVWVAGVRPAESARVRPGERVRLCLALHDAADPVQGPSGR